MEVKRMKFPGYQDVIDSDPEERQMGIPELDDAESIGAVLKTVCKPKFFNRDM